jgi:hypothetical protein
MKDEALVGGPATVEDIDALGASPERAVERVLGLKASTIATKLASGAVHPGVLVGARRPDGTLLGVGYLVHTAAWGWDVTLEYSSSLGLRDRGPTRAALLLELGARCRAESTLASYEEHWTRADREAQSERFVPADPSEAAALITAGFVAAPPERRVLTDLVLVRRLRTTEAGGWREAAPEELSPRSARLLERTKAGAKTQFRRSPEGAITRIEYDPARTDARLRGSASLQLEAGEVDAVEATRDALEVVLGWGADRLWVHKPLVKRLLSAEAPDLALEPDVRTSVRWTLVLV